MLQVIVTTTTSIETGHANSWFDSSMGWDGRSIDHCHIAADHYCGGDSCICASRQKANEHSRSAFSEDSPDDPSWSWASRQFYRISMVHYILLFCTPWTTIFVWFCCKTFRNSGGVHVFGECISTYVSALWARSSEV